MLKIVTVIGARPQIIKASALSRAIKTHYNQEVREVLVHTGQHYDQQMSEVFFKELQIPKPDYNLGIGSGTHGTQTAGMIEGLEQILIREKPNFLLVYGDTNSTLAAAVTASKLHIPIAHVEAGLRSFNKAMPEEINRILCDHTSTLLFSPTQTGINNLISEGFGTSNKGPYHVDNPGVFNVGDVMYDNSLFFSELAQNQSRILERIALKNKEFVLCTVHRPQNVDNTSNLKSIMEALISIADSGMPLVLPLHPRTRKQLESPFEGNPWANLQTHEHIHLLEPVSFLDMISLQKNSKMIITDSGGIQKEAFFFGKPCIVLRPETEWVEIIDKGAGILCDSDPLRISNAYKHFQHYDTPPTDGIYGNGNAAEKILSIMINDC
ncbi:MAG: UDP-N-acetylglucosamine 2-epimerase (non-hydrolyzing) [Roseivirga sp.]